MKHLKTFIKEEKDQVRRREEPGMIMVIIGIMIIIMMVVKIIMIIIRIMIIMMVVNIIMVIIHQLNNICLYFERV